MRLDLWLDVVSMPSIGNLDLVSMMQAENVSHHRRGRRSCRVDVGIVEFLQTPASMSFREGLYNDARLLCPHCIRLPGWCDSHVVKVGGSVATCRCD